MMGTMTTIDLRNWEGWRTEPRDKRGRWTRGEVEKAVKAIASGLAKAPVPPAPAAPAGVSPEEADEAEKQAEDIKGLGSFGGKSAQLSVIRNKKSLKDLQAADYGFQQQAAAKTNPKVTIAHQMVRDEIAKRGGKLADLTAPVRVQGAAEIAQKEKKALIASWSTSYRYKGTTEATGKRTADFSIEMHRLLSTNKQPTKCGPGCQDAHKFITMIDKESVPQKKELQRGLTLSPAAAERMFKQGKTMDMPIGSWTNNPDVADGYANSVEAPPGKTHVILHAAPGAKGTDITEPSIWHGENEVVTGGRMNVDKVVSGGGVMHVYLTQKDFSAH
jgi:hypothetical protein